MSATTVQAQSSTNRIDLAPASTSVLHAGIRPIYAAAISPTNSFIVWPIAKPNQHQIAFQQLATDNSPDPKLVEKLVKDLDGDSYQTRQTAYVSLAEFGRQVEPALRNVLSDTPSKEVHERVTFLLASISPAQTDGHSSDIFAIAVSPDAKHVVTAGKDHIVKVWSPARARVAQELRGHTEAVYALAFGPNPSLLASGSADSSIRLWDLAKGEEVAEFKGVHQSVIHDLVFSPDGTQLFAAGSFDNSVSIWNVQSGEKLQRLQLQDAPMCVAVSADAKTLVVGCYQGTLAVFDLPTGNLRYQHSATDTIRVVRFLQSNDVIVFAGDDGRTNVFDLQKRARIAEWIDHHGRGVRSLSIAKNQASMVTTGDDGRVVWRRIPESALNDETSFK